MPTCTRRAKSTRRLCRREAAEWPRYDDLPAPVVACASHLTPAEWAACQEARARANAEWSARQAEELAAREERGEKAQPAATVAHYVPRPCTGQCVSQERAWGREADSASSLCATCDGYVCLACGEAEVDGIFDFCGRCAALESEIDQEPDEVWDDEIDTGPAPRMRLTAMVNQLVAATGATHRDVNARINRTIGVHTRVGADEQVIRRAAWAARDWLDHLLSSPQADTPAPPDVPDPGARTVTAEHADPSAQVERAAIPGGRVLRSAPMDTPAPHPADDAAGEHAELTVTVRLTGQSARRLRRAAEIQQRPVEEVAAESISDEMHREVHDALYSGSDAYAATLDGLAKRLALIVRELGALPSGAAAHVIAQAAAEKHGPLPEEWHQCMLEQLTEMWTGRTTEFGARPDGSVGPLEDTKVHAMVTPAQWDALARIGAPGSIALGTQEALKAGIAALDR
ncbi:MULTISPECIES: hypothetical protein [Streptomyces]|uniref:Uncharacterized protein n=1 Tax=Streptomyces fradiae ATCC 10745 = DSM 40063 TaxID=1319510 RepID=A0A1Y2NQA6_STRFR|nr:MULTISPECIES: hypothetical protein [Streptomyces]OSY49646.1 hypothetical protein BG846_04786 [Streptomyces fradiae ATCC 10745 = DSM 40063]OSY51105.1 hypothetical protein BG846_03203 [Streptomyces fradiae ATCC 10745 = DSM 40063]OSY51189.1 hypothetical protein BG846_03171 [Streptomyces fradiae ATCC 10745 = DSM 40063]